MPRTARSPSEGRVRIQLEIPEKAKARIERIRALIEADSLTEVIRRAITLFDMVTDAVKNRGATLVLREKDGKEQMLVVL